MVTFQRISKFEWQDAQRNKQDGNLTGKFQWTLTGQDGASKHWGKEATKKPPKPDMYISLYKLQTIKKGKH